MESSIQRTRARNGTASVSVRGEIDYSNADELAECLRAAAADRAPQLVLVDLTGVTFIDSTGLGALIEGYRASAEAGAKYVVANPTAAFRRVLTVTGLCEFFGLPDSGAITIEESATTQATGS